MAGSLLNRRIARWLTRLLGRAEIQKPPPRRRGPVIHVIIIDGTMSSLDAGCETNAGLAMKLLRAKGGNVSVYYEPGIQWSNWRNLGDIIAGRGINRQIRRAYGYLASRYRPGDKIYLLGYSRGAYAVRSLAGVIDRVGLLQAKRATQRNVRDVYRHYRVSPDSLAARDFAQAKCHADVEIEMIGVWDTVKSLGLNLPVIWRLSVPKHEFHNHELGPAVKHGYHALARDERRVAYTPVMWSSPSGWHGHVEQMWFRGSHGDVGGMLGGYAPARPLSNISLVWMLERAEAAGLPLLPEWQSLFPQDAAAPSSGSLRGMGRWLIARRARRIGRDPSERVHPSVAVTPAPRDWWRPRLGQRASP